MLHKAVHWLEFNWKIIEICISGFEEILLELEQLECLRSEIPPATPWLPILAIHIKSQV